MDTVKALFTMSRSPRYGFRPSEPSTVRGVRAGKSRVAGELSAHGAGHAKPATSSQSDFLHLPEPDEHLLCTMGEKMLRTARVAGQPLTLVVMQVYDLPEVELVFGHAATEEVIDEVMTELTRVAAREGLLVRSAADTFALLLPGSGTQASLEAVVARFGKLCVIEFELGGDEILLMPDVRVHTFGLGECVQVVYERLRGVIAKTRAQEQLRCEYPRPNKRPRIRARRLLQPKFESAPCG